MNGFTDDLINCISQQIVAQWEKRGGNITYFVGLVKGARIKPEELDNWMSRNGDTCPECVNHVFAQVLYTDFLEKEGGAK